MRLSCSYVAVSLQIFICTRVHSSIALPDTIMKQIAKVVPVLNGRDSDGNPKYLGPKTTKIHRYLIVLWVAKSSPTFRLLGKEIDNSIYFTLYKLWQVADSFKQIKPYHLPIRYDRTKVAIRVYTKMKKEKRWVNIMKRDGRTYVTTTKNGDKVSKNLLKELIDYMDNDSEEGFVVKGVKSGASYKPESQSAKKSHR
jgi:hypothetical protein